MMQELGANKVICLSSTSQFTKTSSSTPAEEQTVQRLIDGEQQLRDWAAANQIAWTVLRPTLIYGRGNDRNLSEIVKIINKFRFFPVFGAAQGLRQPVYVDDVALACVQALYSDKTSNKAYNISGAEQLSYQEMVKRVFVAMGLKPRLLRIHLVVFNLALFFLRLIPRYKGWNADMVLRMNRDMVFDHDQAAADFGFSPQAFTLTDKDVGQALPLS
ncbi:NAD-dependent epimerase/dehydratase family protein [Alcaligenaceae bacterium]|nr:NAD-dependent epimerase/dehydratase family protein [Alcaligenaceae bacterium]